MRSIAARTGVLGVLLLLIAPAGFADDAEAEIKEAVDKFKEDIKETKSYEKQARLIQQLGSSYRDDAVVAAISRYLRHTPRDIHYRLPLTTVDVLSKFRGSLKASVSLLGVLPMYKKIPFIHDRILEAIGKVGHESALTLFEKDLKGKNANAAVKAVQGISDLPGHIAMTVLFNEYKRLESKKAGAQDDLKAFIDKVQPEILKAIKKLSGEAYPTMKEMLIWWDRRGQKYLDKAKAEEEKLRSTPPDPSAARAPLPPIKIVDLSFNENKGETTRNGGTSGMAVGEAALGQNPPKWSGSKPPNAGASSLDFGPQVGAKAVDMRSPMPHLLNLTSFTITGWLNLREEPETEPPGGMVVVSWLMPKREGVELVYRKDGSLQIGIGEPAADSPAKSKEKLLPDFDEKSTANNALGNNWRFFAVTYDQGLASGHVKFFVGRTNANAALVSTVDYDRGPSGKKISPMLTVGGANAVVRRGSPPRSFPGLVDQIRIFGNTETATGALTLEQIREVQDWQRRE